MKQLKVFFIFLFLIACAEEVVVTKPECLLSEQEMIDLMVDFSLAKSSKSLGRQGLKDSGIKPLEYLFIKHGVDSIGIRENLKYYNSDIKKFNEIYSEVAKLLKEKQEVLQQVIDSLPENKEKNKDQIDEDVLEEGIVVDERSSDN